MNEPTDTEILDWASRNVSAIEFMESMDNWYVDYFDHGERKSTPLKATLRKALIDAYNGITDED